MNWILLIKHLLILRLRDAELLKAWLLSLISFTSSKYDSDEVWKEDLINDLKVCPQRLAFEKLLNDEFDYINRSIIVEDGTDGDVTIWSNNETILIAGNTTPVVFVTPMSETSVGSDVIIKIPTYLEAATIMSYCKRYLFVGIGIKIINI